MNESENPALQPAIEALDQVYEIKDWLVQFSPLRASGEHRIPGHLSFQLTEKQRDLENLRIAAEAPPALAIYGASQSGKSLFVGRLIENSSGKNVLGVSINDNTPPQLDFVKDLNPGRGEEATAVVTRFSRSDRVLGHHHVPDAPVLAKLFSRADLLKSLARGFFTECRGEKEWGEESVIQFIEEEFKDESRPRVADQDWLQDIIDTYKYLHQSVRHHRLKIRPQSFTQILLENPLSDVGYRRLVAAIFWEDWPELTNLFDELLKTKETHFLGANAVSLPWSGVPFVLDSSRPDKLRTRIVDGIEEILWTDFGVVSDSSGHLKLVHSKPEARSIPLAAFQSLVAEVQIPVISSRLPDHSRGLFEKADCLDIPGAVSDKGQARPDKATFTEAAERSPALVLEVLKRGKVGYLFEKYADEFQSSVLLYLQALGNIQAKGELPPQITHWGSGRFGEDWPHELSSDEIRSPSLIMALTGVDRHLKAGPENRDFDSLITKQVKFHFDEWFTSYGAKGLPYKGLHFLRYPGTMDGNHEDINGVKEWAKIFCSDPAIKRHVQEPEEMWKDVMSEDGGMTRILKNATAKFSDSDRDVRLVKAILSAREDVQSLIQTILVDTSMQAEAARRKSVINDVINWLEQDKHGINTQDLVSALGCSAVVIETALREGEPSRDFPMPIPLDFEEIAKSILWKWRGAVELEGLSDLPAETVSELAGYIHQYLNTCCVTELASKLREIYHEVPEHRRKHIIRRYGPMIMDDFILGPGPRPPLSDQDKEEIWRQQPFKTLFFRWREILEERLLSVLEGDWSEPPPGNDELQSLLARFNEKGAMA